MMIIIMKLILMGSPSAPDSHIVAQTLTDPFP